VSRLSKERKNLQIKIDAIKPYECDLNDKHHSELLRVVTAISKDSCAVEQLCSETNKVLGGENNLVWWQDMANCNCIQFERDQSTAVTGSQGNLWSQITVRMGE